MDLNALPEEHEDETFRGRFDQQPPRRDYDDRHRGVRRPYDSEGSRHGAQSQRGHGYQNKRFRPNDRNKLPDGWLDCPAYGHNIDFIIPSKVPLGDYFVVHGKRYSWREVIHEQGKLRRELGMVIDLTNTSRYYEAADWRRAGIAHVKIACKGRGSVPGNDSVNDFIYEVLQFYSRKEQSNDKYILVHCTHGFNRTGYMIVHFLVRTQSISVTEALHRFADARPPGIYKQDYIDELYTFYGERRPESLVCPPTPEWKSSSELDNNGKMTQGEDDGSGASAEKDVLKNIEMTNDDIIGDALPHDEQDMMQKCCYDLLKLNRRAKGNLQFPGSHPVSLNRDNLQLLRQRYYYATWKADGTRYMMLITWNGCYLIDRKFCFRRVRVRFPLKQNNEGFGKETHNFTLLDGEMVIETLQDTQKQVRRYLIYDVMAINNVPVVEMPFCERWNMLTKEVIQPRNLERQLFEQCRHHFYRYERSPIPFYRYDMEPFSVRRKDFWVLSAATKVLSKFIPNLSHEADGLIFQGWDDPYVPRTHEGLLKWKYMDSVDFFFEVAEDHSELLFLNEGRKKKIVEGSVFFENGLDPSSFSGKIIECHWDSKKNMWVFMRTRTDKSNPNEFNTYMKVMRSIKDNITQDLLLDEISQIVRLPMYADRIRGDCETHSGKRR